MNGLRPIKGNARLVDAAHYVIEWPEGKEVTPLALDGVEKDAEQAVLRGEVLVVSTALPPDVFMRAGIVPLRWGAPRIIVAANNWAGHRATEAIMENQEPCRAWRLWRHAWDDKTDLLAKPPLRRREAAR